MTKLDTSIEIELPVTAKDFCGQVFGRLTAIAPVSVNTKGVRWLCICDCGTEHEIRYDHLMSGRTVSCGCVRVEKSRDRLFKHGKTGSKEYKAWVEIKHRCYNKKSTSYDRYGGRGIAMCDRWKCSFEDFLADMGERPESKHSIDRIDNDGDYTPENCRWATHTEQARNKSSNVLITYAGKTLCGAEWAEITGIEGGTIRQRVRDGLPNSGIFAGGKHG